MTHTQLLNSISDLINEYDNKGEFHISDDLFQLLWLLGMED